MQMCVYCAALWVRSLTVWACVCVCVTSLPRFVEIRVRSVCAVVHLSACFCQATFRRDCTKKKKSRETPAEWNIIWVFSNWIRKSVSNQPDGSVYHLNININGIDLNSLVAIVGPRLCFVCLCHVCTVTHSCCINIYISLNRLSLKWIRCSSNFNNTTIVSFTLLARRELQQSVCCVLHTVYVWLFVCVLYVCESVFNPVFRPRLTCAFSHSLLFSLTPSENTTRAFGRLSLFSAHTTLWVWEIHERKARKSYKVIASKVSRNTIRVLHNVNNNEKSNLYIFF